MMAVGPLNRMADSRRNPAVIPPFGLVSRPLGRYAHNIRGGDLDLLPGTSMRAHSTNSCSSLSDRTRPSSRRSVFMRRCCRDCSCNIRGSDGHDDPIGRVAPSVVQVSFLRCSRWPLPSLAASHSGYSSIRLRGVPHPKGDSRFEAIRRRIWLQSHRRRCRLHVYITSQSKLLSSNSGF
jgi:hypothetical protein